MTVNKFKIKVPNSGVDNISVNIPLTYDLSHMNQEKLIEQEFINIESEKAINPIIDNEKFSFKPYYLNTLVSTISFNLFLTGGSHTTWNQLGFEYDDINNNRNNFKNSFLRLYFYDSILNTNQNLIDVIDLFPEVYSEDRYPLDNVNSGKVKELNEIGVKFESYNGNRFSDRSSDGFNFYFFKDVIKNINPFNLYMRADFFNAKDGSIYHLMVNEGPILVTDLKDNLYTNYSLQKNGNGYNYTIDDTQNHINYNNINRTYSINLYDINVD